MSIEKIVEKANKVIGKWGEFFNEVDRDRETLAKTATELNELANQTDEQLDRIAKIDKRLAKLGKEWSK